MNRAQVLTVGRPARMRIQIDAEDRAALIPMGLDWGVLAREGRQQLVIGGATYEAILVELQHRVHRPEAVGVWLEMELIEQEIPR